MAEARRPRSAGSTSVHEARRAFRAALLEPGGEFIATKHFTQQMASRRFDMNDVVQIARTGRIPNPPEYDMSHGEWKWRIEGRAVDGRIVYVVFSLLGDKQVKGITIVAPWR